MPPFALRFALYILSAAGEQPKRSAACPGPWRWLSARAQITSGFSQSFRRGIVSLPKIRNPKFEIRNKPEGPKSESQNQAASRRFEPSSLRILNLFRTSDFGL